MRRPLFNPDFLRLNNLNVWQGFLKLFDKRHCDRQIPRLLLGIGVELKVNSNFYYRRIG